MTTSSPAFDVLPPETLALARRELMLEKKAAEIRKTNALEFFRPHAKQSLFFEAASFYYRYARTGNRFGKSEMGAAEDVSFALGYRPWYPEGSPLRHLGIPTHPTKGLIVTTDWDKSTEIFTSEAEGSDQGKLFKYIPKSAFIDRSLNHSGAIDTIRIRHVSGGVSVICLDTVKSFKQNALGQESSSWDWAHFDEPIPEAMYNAIIRGFIDRDGRCWFTCTPLSEPWIDAKFIPDLEDQSKAEMTSSTGDFWMMTGSTMDNPHNKPEAIERVMAQYSDDEQETRRSGTPKAYAGLVYKEFQWAEHVLSEVPKGWKSWSEPPPSFTVRVAVDFHFRKNDAVLFIATSPNEISYVFAEIWQQLLVEEEVREIKSILGERDYQPLRMDPLASTPNKVTDITAMDEYRRLGLAVLPATKDPVNGIRAVKATLKARDKGGRPVLFFNPVCRRTLFEISRGFIWDGDQNKPVKQNDDMMENLYRLCLEGLSYIEPATAEDYRAFSPSDIPDFSNISYFPGLDDDEPEKKKVFQTSRYRQ